VIGFGNMAEPDFASSPSGNVAEKYPPAGGMGGWGLPQQARLSYKRYACNCAAYGGRGYGAGALLFTLLSFYEQ